MNTDTDDVLRQISDAHLLGLREGRRAEAERLEGWAHRNDELLDAKSAESAALRSLIGEMVDRALGTPWPAVADDLWNRAMKESRR